MTDRIQKNKGSGYTNKNGLICMIRCFECGNENWAPAVATGGCAWCSHNPNGEPNV